MPLRNHRVKVRGLPMHALVSRTYKAVDRLPVVLVHGLGMSSRYMAPTAQRLASDFRVFAPDLPGFGDSGKPDHILSVPELADALAEWMSVCGLSPAALVANSFGCQIVTQLALSHPDLVDRLVLQGPTGDPCMRTPSRQLVCLCRD